MPIRSKSVMIPCAKHPRHHRDLSSAAPRGLEKKKATRGIPLSHYGMLDQKCSYFIDLFWRAAREPLRWPSLARVHGEVTVPLNGEIYVRQQNEDRRGNDDDGERGGRRGAAAPVLDNDFDDLIETSSRH